MAAKAITYYVEKDCIHSGMSLQKGAFIVPYSFCSGLTLNHSSIVLLQILVEAERLAGS